MNLYSFKVLNKKFLFTHKDKLHKIKGTLISIALGLFVGFFIILFVKKENPFVVYKNILAIPFSSKYLFKKLLFQIGVFILLGSSMAIGFKYNVFNIGATAQMLMSFLICYVLIQYKLLPDNPVSKVLLILISLIFGVLVGLLIGLLKIYFNIHEVVSSIFLNYIIFYLIVYIGEKYLPINIAQKGFFIPTLEDDKFSNYIFSPAMSSNQYIFVLLFSIVIVVFLSIWLNFSTLGYKLKVSGMNKDAAKFNGINNKLSIIQTFIISSALAGMAGYFFLICYNYGEFRIKTPLFLPTIAFESITIGLLAFFSPIGSIFTSFFYGILIMGSEQIELARLERINVETLKLMISFILLFSSLCVYFMNFNIYQTIKDKIRFYKVKKDVMFEVKNLEEQLITSYFYDFDKFVHTIKKMNKLEKQKEYKNFWISYLNKKNDTGEQIKKLLLKKEERK